MVTIHGTGFNYGSTVAFGSTAATSVTYESPFELKAVSPAGSGVANVTVSTFAGTSATSSADQIHLRVERIHPGGLRRRHLRPRHGAIPGVAAR